MNPLTYYPGQEYGGGKGGGHGWLPPPSFPIAPAGKLPYHHFTARRASSYFCLPAKRTFTTEPSIYSHIQYFIYIIFHCDLNFYMSCTLLFTHLYYFTYILLTHSHNLLTHINLYTYSYNCTHLFIHLSIHIFVL